MVRYAKGAQPYDLGTGIWQSREKCVSSSTASKILQFPITKGKKFIVTNSDSKNETETTFVSLYESGCESKFEAPGKPGKPQSSNISHTGLQLNWGIPKYAASVQSYTVSYTDDESSDQWCTQTISGAEQQLLLSGLIPGATYCFKVKAETSVGCSPDSDVYKTRLPPSVREIRDPNPSLFPISAPGKPIATFVTHKSIMLEWKKPKCGAYSVKQYQLFSQKTSSSEEKAELVKHVELKLLLASVQRVRSVILLRPN